MRTQGPIGKPRPTFLWQGLLIILPVIVLAGYCFIALRQDQLVARQEAVQRATTIAQDLLPKIRAALEPDENDQHMDGRAFAVSLSGELHFPAPYSKVPTPQPLDSAELDAEQARLWQASQNFGTDPKDRSAALEALKTFLEAQPPKRFAAAGQYRLGLLLKEQNEIEAAADALNLIFERFAYVRSESGVPWRLLAGLKLLELEALNPARVSKQQRMPVAPLAQDLLRLPTALTPYLWEQTKGFMPQDEAEWWERTWENEELLRELFLESRPCFQSGIFTGPGSKTPTNRLLAVGAEPVALPEMLWVTALRASRETVELKNEHWLLTHWDEAAWAERGSPRRTLKDLDDYRQRKGIPQATIVTVRLPWNRNLFVPKDPFEGAAASEELLEPRDVSTHHWYVYRTESEIGSQIAAVLNSAGSIPDYFGVEVEVAGRPVTKGMPDLNLWQRVPYAGKTGGIRKEVTRERSTNVLASAVRHVQGKELLAVNVLLTSPSVLFERQTTRSFWIGTLIGLSSLAALSGLAAAWRAFQRQIQLTEMKSQFVSSVSHELRAPIASVRLLAESLERGKIQGSEKQNEYFRFIGQECRRLSALIENVLDFSRIDQGRKQYELEPADLVGLVEQTARLMETYAAEKQVKLALALPAELAAVRPQPNIDGKAIQQALVNLVDNAIKHSAPGQTVTVGLERGQEAPASEPLPEPDLWLWVEDRGPGIPAAEQEKIFERFYRCGSELRRETQGVGIGLSIVKHIVEAHGGRVLVESVVGEGSRFTISLPPASHEPQEPGAT